MLLIERAFSSEPVIPFSWVFDMEAAWAKATGQTTAVLQGHVTLASGVTIVYHLWAAFVKSPVVLGTKGDREPPQEPYNSRFLPQQSWGVRRVELPTQRRGWR